MQLSPRFDRIGNVKTEERRMSTYTKTMTLEAIHLLEKKLMEAKAEKRNTPPYALFQMKTSDCTITAYQSGKVVFQGVGADVYRDEKEQKTTTFQQSFPQYGSDEVGTGDYFGPIVVCACAITEADLSLLQTLPIQDSKQLKDHVIKKIAPQLQEQLTYSLLIVENEKYNQIHATNNMNAIKAKLHNQAFLHLKNKMNVPLDNIIIDQFTPPNQYYRYLSQEKQIIHNIHFETKAENKYLSVACASIIARATFLTAIEQLEQRFDFHFPKGAGKNVDEAGAAFLKQYGKNALSQVAKLHFKNSEKILATLK